MLDKQELIWNKIHKDGPTSPILGTQCWLWRGCRNNKGYGQFFRRQNGKRKGFLAHRFIYEATFGPIPERMVIDHKCHNPSCVNPDHLRLATRGQNQQNWQAVRRDSASGVRGVHWNNANQKWAVAVKADGCYVYRRMFDTLEDAEAAAIAARKKYHTHNDLDRAVTT